MSFSLNEVQSQAQKAARGAGYSWGLAEDAGAATRWLCAQRIDGVAALAALLTDAPTKEACAITQGTRLSDRARVARSESRVLHRITQPLLLMPFLGIVARKTDQCLMLSWQDGEAKTEGQHLYISGNRPMSGDALSIAATDERLAPSHKATRAGPDDKDWQTLTRFAALTYAPATEESRKLGAGDAQPDAP